MENTAASSIIAELAKIDAGSLNSDPDVRKEALMLSKKLVISLQDPGTYSWEVALWVRQFQLQQNQGFGPT